MASQTVKFGKIRAGAEHAREGMPSRYYGSNVGWSDPSRHSQWPYLGVLHRTTRGAFFAPRPIS